MMNSDPNQVVGIVLAAGLGTRMRSDKAKVLHEILGRPMVQYVVDAALAVMAHVVVVIGHQAERVRQVLGTDPRIHYAVQSVQRGTGHAAQCAMPLLPPGAQTVAILCGDAPLIQSATLERLIVCHRETKNHITLLAMELEDPYGYGRVVIDAHGCFSGIVEEADASNEQQQIRLVNSGVYCIERGWLEKALGCLQPANAQGEYYLTDILSLGYREGKQIGAIIATDAGELQGVNTPQELAAAEQRLIRRQSKTA